MEKIKFRKVNEYPQRTTQKQIEIIDFISDALAANKEIFICTSDNEAIQIKIDGMNKRSIQYIHDFSCKKLNTWGNEQA